MSHEVELNFLPSWRHALLHNTSDSSYTLFDYQIENFEANDADWNRDLWDAWIGSVQSADRKVKVKWRIVLASLAVDGGTISCLLSATRAWTTATDLSRLHIKRSILHLGTTHKRSGFLEETIEVTTHKLPKVDGFHCWETHVFVGTRGIGLYNDSSPPSNTIHGVTRLELYKGNTSCIFGNTTWILRQHDLNP